MGDVSAEPSMEDILSSIKRIIAEEGEAAPAPRQKKPIRPAALAQRAAALAAPTIDIDDDDDEILELSDPVPAPKAVKSPRPEGDILSRQTADASRGALEALSRLVVKPDTAGSDTLEGLVREMLRPMLREWLDANLPELVEQMVAREIARITGQAG